MTIYGFPSIEPRSSRWDLVANTKTFASPFSRSVQTGARNGTAWLVTLDFSNLKDPNRQILQGFLAQLNGQEHRFTLHDHAYTGRGILTGSPLIKGASQAGHSLLTDGWTASQTGIVKAGDQVGFGDVAETRKQLVMVTADANSDGSGNATIPINPGIHVTPENNAPITIVNPYGIFMLVDQQQGWNNRPGIFSDFVVTCVEDVLA